jgi:hypothetical protein
MRYLLGILTVLFSLLLANSAAAQVSQIKCAKGDKHLGPNCLHETIMEPALHSMNQNPLPYTIVYAFNGAGRQITIWHGLGHVVESTRKYIRVVYEVKYEDQPMQTVDYTCNWNGRYYEDSD